MQINIPEQSARRNFNLTFVDIIIGIVLGVGFQWWSMLHQPWQYLAFGFAYLNLIDYWIDFSPLLKKYPSKNEFDIILNFVIIFFMFNLAYSTHLSLGLFLLAFALYRLADLAWLWRVRTTHRVSPSDEVYITNWSRYEAIEAFAALLLAGVSVIGPAPALIVLTVFMLIRLTTRIMASTRYRSVYYK